MPTFITESRRIQLNTFDALLEAVRDLQDIETELAECQEDTPHTAALTERYDTTIDRLFEIADAYSYGSTAAMEMQRGHYTRVLSA